MFDFVVKVLKNTFLLLFENSGAVSGEHDESGGKFHQEIMPTEKRHQVEPNETSLKLNTSEGS